MAQDQDALAATSARIAAQNMQAAAKSPKTKEQHVFKSRLPSSKYILKSGKEATFINGRYLTNSQVEIDELNAEIDAGHPHLYVDGNEETLDLSANDQLKGLRDRFFAEFMAMNDAEKNELKRINPADMNGPLVTASQSDQNFRIKAGVTEVAGQKFVDGDNGDGLPPNATPANLPPGFRAQGTGIASSANAPGTNERGNPIAGRTDGPATANSQASAPSNASPPNAKVDSTAKTSSTPTSENNSTLAALKAKMAQANPNPASDGDTADAKPDRSGDSPDGK